MTDKLIIAIIFAAFTLGWYSLINESFEVNPRYNFSTTEFAFVEVEK